MVEVLNADSVTDALVPVCAANVPAVPVPLSYVIEYA